MDSLPPLQAYAAILDGFGYSRSRIADILGVNRATIWRWYLGEEYRLIRGQTALELPDGIKSQVMGLTLGVIQYFEVGRMKGTLGTSELLALLKTILPFLAGVESHKK